MKSRMSKRGKRSYDVGYFCMIERVVRTFNVRMHPKKNNRVNLLACKTCRVDVNIKGALAKAVIFIWFF